MSTRRTVFFISDRTGITAEMLGNSLLTQFENIQFQRITIPFVDSPERAAEAVQQVNATAAEEGQPVLARVRSTREPGSGRLAVTDGQVAVVFDGAEEGVAPGQACVLYDPADPERVLGGGFIAGTTRQMDLAGA